MSQITTDWVRLMARYTKWQNDSMFAAMRTLSDAELRRDRGAFFGSILGTANHLLWADDLWLSRFDGGPGPTAGIADSRDMTLTLAAWSAERFRVDGRLALWVDGLHQIDLSGPFTWFSGAAQKEMTLPKWQVVTHFFNHQTHHRGQIHAMLTSAGVKTTDTDLAMMEVV